MRDGEENINDLSILASFTSHSQKGLPCRVPSSGGIQPGLRRVSFAGKFDTRLADLLD